MPLYELFCIASHNPTSPANLRQLIDGLARQVHSSGGVVRSLRNMGVGVVLPSRMRANQGYHTRGDQFLMTFDTSPIILKKLEGTLRSDPLVVRWTVLKQGSAVKELAPSHDHTISFPEASNR